MISLAFVIKHRTVSLCWHAILISCWQSLQNSFSIVLGKWTKQPPKERRNCSVNKRTDQALISECYGSRFQGLPSDTFWLNERLNAVKQRGRGRQRERRKTIGLMRQNNRSAHVLLILVHFLAVLCKTRTRTKNDAWRLIFFLYSYSYTYIHRNLGPGQFSSIFHVKQIGIIANEFQKRQVTSEMMFPFPSPSSSLKVGDTLGDFRRSQRSAYKIA